MLGADPPLVHPDPEEIAAYLSGGIPRAERESLDTHFARCRSCRAELMSARRLLRGASSRPWRLVLPAAAAAAAILALVLIGTLRDRGVQEEDRLRESPSLSPDLGRIEVVEPGNGASVAPDGLAFSWRARGHQPLYRMTLTDASGGVIWSTETSDTSVALPAEVALRRGQEYLWYVDALDVDGRSVTSGIRRFRLAP
jgi:hypothetical protein